MRIPSKTRPRPQCVESALPPPVQIASYSRLPYQRIIGTVVHGMRG